MRPGCPAGLGDRELGQAVRLRARAAAAARGARGVATKPFNLVGMRWRGVGEARDRDSRATLGTRLEQVGGAARARDIASDPLWVGEADARPVPAEQARARPAPALRERRVATRTPGSVPPRTAQPAFVSRAGVGRQPVPAAPAAAVRDGQGGGRAPHGLAQRLHAGGGAGDRARDLPLPPQLERLERHRLQRSGRQVRRALRGPRGRARPRRRGRARAGLQLGDRRDREHRRPHHGRGDAGGAQRDGELHPLEAGRAPPAAVGQASR